jgi:mannose-6-phosphate isomerase-like protein (cupin superfamily)
MADDKDQPTTPASGVRWADTDRVTPFSYVKPNVERGAKGGQMLARSPLAAIGVQVFNGGGENNLHMHPHTDEAWYVLSGRIRFYTTGDEVIGEYGRDEGVFVPMGVPYWFESIDGEAEIIRFGAYGPGAPTDGRRDRVNVAPLKDGQDPSLLADQAAP